MPRRCTPTPVPPNEATASTDSATRSKVTTSKIDKHDINTYFTKKTFKEFQRAHFRFNPNKPRVIPDVWPTPLDQIGGTCGLYALYIALIYSIMPEKDDLLTPNIPIPVQAEKNLATTTLLSIAKKNKLSFTGEILNIDYFAIISQRAGFQTKQSIRSNHSNFHNDLCEQIDNGHTVIVSCDVDNRNSFPKQNNGDCAHWVLAFGYAYIEEKLFFLVTQYGSYYLFSGEDLLASNNQNPQALCKIPQCSQTNFNDFYFTLFPVPVKRMNFSETVASNTENASNALTN